MDIEAVTGSEFYADEIETDHEDNLESKITCNKSLLPDPCSAKQHILVLSDLCPAEHHVPKDNTSMIEFDMMRSSLPANPASATVDQRFLISTANWSTGAHKTFAQ